MNSVIFLFSSDTSVLGRIFFATYGNVGLIAQAFISLSSFSILILYHLNHQTTTIECNILIISPVFISLSLPHAQLEINYFLLYYAPCYKIVIKIVLLFSSQFFPNLYINGLKRL